MAALVLGIDVGTTSTKVVLADPAAGVVAQASEPVALSSPHPGWAEADPGQWWANLVALVPAVLAAASTGSGKPVTAADIAAVATTGMVPAVIPADAAGRPLRRAILQNDARATAEIRELAAALPGLDFVARTGSALTQQSVGPTLLWLARHEPGAWAPMSAGTGATVQGSYDWLATRLGAAPHVERNWALESGLFELQPDGALTPLQPVRDALARLAGIKPQVIPPVADPGTVIGAVSPAAAAETGLRPGTPIVAGGADHVLSAYAAGLASPGDWLVKLGGAGDILVVSDYPLVDERLYLDAHPVTGLWLPNGCMATSGSLIRWFQSVSGSASSGPAPVAELEAEALAASPAELICLPYFLGEKSPLHDPDLRGAFLGLHLGHTRGDMYRAILEGVAYGFRHHAEVFTEREVALRPAARVSNGGSKSVVWKQILADALGVALEPVLDHPGAALGAALAAAVGIGAVGIGTGGPGTPSPQAWAAAARVPGMVTIGAPIEPDPAHAARYAEAYQIYRDAGVALTPISHRLATRSVS
jgi:xylulokinase